MDGIIIVDKPKDFTSRDIVNIVGKKLKTKKIGHTGTLDPSATGVLVLCVGKATKLVDMLMCDDKEYIAEVTLGIETDTLDLEGKVLNEQKCLINKSDVEKTLKNMIGTYEQEVPIYSAVKINGKKLYEYARNDEKVELPKRLVNIKNMSLISDIKYENNKSIFSIKCHVSKGTYIRSLVRDLSHSLNTIGVMSNLRRIRQGNFNISSAFTIDEINNDDFHVLDIKDVLKDIYTIVCDKELEFKIKNGVVLDNIYNQDMVVFVNENKDVLAIYKAHLDKLKVYKMF